MVTSRVFWGLQGSVGHSLVMDNNIAALKSFFHLENKLEGAKQKWGLMSMWVRG